MTRTFQKEATSHHYAFLVKLQRIQLTEEVSCSFSELNQTKIHLSSSTSSLRVSKRRKMCGPVSRCLGQKHVSYLLVLPVDTCTAPQLGQLFTKYKNQELFTSNTLDKKGFKPTHKQILCAERKQKTNMALYRSAGLIPNSGMTI